MRMSRLSVFTLLTIAVTAIVLSLSSRAPADDPEGFELPDPGDRPAIAAAVREWLAGAWESYGYSERDSEELAERSIQILKHQTAADFLPLDEVNATVIMHPDSEPTSLIYSHLMAHGIDDATAWQYSIYAFLLANGRELSNPQELGATECWVVPVRITYCKDDEFGIRRNWSRTGNFDKTCWDEHVIPFLPEQLPNCVYPQVEVFELSFSCFGADNQCVDVTYTSQSVYKLVPCDMAVISCDCLPVQTAPIPVRCCEQVCEGCPCEH